jgi:hypothetical protein
VPASGPSYHRLLQRIGGVTGIILVAGALLRAFVLTRGIAAIDRGYVVDDAYYTLSIARSFARSFAPTVDGVELTTGFQPLLALLEMPAFLLGASADHAALAALVVLAAADVAVAYALSRLARLAGGDLAGGIGAALWSLSPVALGETFVGLEGPLAAATTMFAALALARLVASPSPSPSSRRSAAILGVWLGLCVLARVDTIVFVALVLGVVVARYRAAAPATLAGAALVSGPWLLVCTVLTGRPVPESGAAVLAFVQEGNTAESLGRVAGFAAGFVGPGGLVDLPEARTWLVAHPIFGALALAAVVTVLAVVAWRLPVAARVWMFGMLALVPFYVLVLPAIWAFHRYLLPVRVAATLVIALLLARAVARIGDRLRAPVLAAGGVTMVVLTVLATASRLGGATHGEIDAFTGYRGAALAMFAAAPPGATLGSFQSGALGYFRPEGTSVVNLDGVVSRDAHRAYVERRIDDRLRARGVTYVADWGSGLGELQRRSHAGAFRLEPLALGPPQGRRRFVLARVVWPAP